MNTKKIKKLIETLKPIIELVKVTIELIIEILKS